MRDNEPHADEWQYRLSYRLFKAIEPLLIWLIKLATKAVNGMITFLRWLQRDKVNDERNV